MGKKSKKLLELILLVIILTVTMLGTWLWQAAKEPPLIAGDHISLTSTEVGKPVSFGITLYNTGARKVRLTSVEINGEGWEQAQAQVLPSPLVITSGSLSSWASQKAINLQPVAGYRMPGDGNAVLGLTVRKLAPTAKVPSVVITYRYWLVLHGRLQIPLQ